ncbi:MAG: class I SAM-dependent methyltransferase [Bacteroidota bacterium]|nr:class I SAM-dependent methyltransferase [Bacteroidota bacterium]
MAEKEAWRNWNEEKDYGNMFFKRATGELPEMESSKAVSNLLKKIYQPKMSLLDVGCGVGHYLRSLRAHLDKDINYNGTDATPYYVELAQKAYGNPDLFRVGDIFNLPHASESYDIVMCNNVVMHLPPDLEKPFSELIRLSKKYIVIRAMFGERNYVVREVLTPKDFEFDKNELNVASFELTKLNFRYFNMYTETYYRNLISALSPKSKVEIIKDMDWKPFDNSTDSKTPTATKTMGEFQVSGNLILDWRFIVIEK